MGSRLEKNSDSVRKRIAKHTFKDEAGDEYGGSAFGGHQEYFRRKRVKLQNLDADIREKAGPLPQIFRGVVAHVNGYTQPSLNDLHTLIVQHGGGFLQYLDGKTTVTHLIASSLTPKKAVEFRRYRIVKPAWVVDSIQAGKLLPWSDYRVLDEGEKQKVLALDKGKVMSEPNVKMTSYRDQTDKSWYTSQLRGSLHGTPANTPTPSNGMRARFSRQKLPTPDDDIEDLPPSHQPEPVSKLSPRRLSKHETLITPVKTSPAMSSQGLLDEITDEDFHDCLYADPPAPPAGQQARPESDCEDRTKTLPFKSVASPPQNKVLTAEEHNANLLRDPKIRKSTVVDPNFIEQYYRESRLHHLSTWKADLKSHLQALASEKSSTQRVKERRPLGARRYILHVDFDSFFAAISLKKQPQYKDKPAVVAHGQGNGSEIASCNYPARKYGIKNGMWMKRALEMCPDLKVLPYDFPAYEEASRAFYDAILATEGIVQSVSIDEALIDVSSLCIAAGGSDGRQVCEESISREQAKADSIAQFLRDEVKARTECNVSVGIGGNILLAKVALRKAKPAGQHQIKPEEAIDFIGELEVQGLPGVAKSIGAKFEEIGVKYVKDMRELSKERLVRHLGPKTGEKLWEYARGIDRQEVGEQVVRKSVSAEVNWGVRFENQEQADEFITSLCGELQKRLLKEKVKGKQFTMKVMRRSPDAPLDPPKSLGHGHCQTFNKSMMLGIATNSKEVLTKEALSILRSFGFSPGDLRGIGIQMTKLEPMKSATDGNLASSQHRLQFKTVNAEPTRISKAPQIAEVDPIQDDPETPRKYKIAAEDERVAFGARELNHSTPSRRPLNMLGTQFIMPTQVDPKVLAELPEDIRSKLLRQTRQSSPTPAARKVEPTTPSKSSPSTPRKSTPFALTALPAQSQLDPEILAALPADVRAEILSQYVATSSPSRRSRYADQTLLPQSPRKNRIIGIPAKKPIVPVKRGRGRPPKSVALAAAAQKTTVTKEGKTLTQANFISIKREREREDDSREEDSDELNPDFLAALPEDLRKEIVEEHRRKKLSTNRLTANLQKAKPVPQAVQPPQTLRIPRPLRPTFTTQKLSREKDLRVAMKEWVRAFSDEGPYKEDVAALVKYLGKVVGEERDMGKAVGVVRWLSWVVGEEESDGLERSKWEAAIEVVMRGVEDAARKRGLGSVCFD